LSSRKKSAGTASERTRTEYKPKSTNGDRRYVAEQAARIMAEESIRDYQLAKKKALARLGLNGVEALPTNQEIEAALNERLQLFATENTDRRTREAYEVAIEAMEFLSSFLPRLSGSLVRGTLTDNMPVELHLIADTPEDVTMMLIAEDVPYELFDRRLRFSGNRYEQITGVKLQADSIAVEALIFDQTGFREPPLSPVDGQAMQRLDVKATRAKFKLLV